MAEYHGKNLRRHLYLFSFELGVCIQSGFPPFLQLRLGRQSCSLECVAVMAQAAIAEYPHSNDFTDERRDAPTPARTAGDDGGVTTLQYDPVSYYTFRA